MIIFDTETTGLPAKDEQPLQEHPEIIEFAGIKVDDETLEEISRFEFLCKPLLPIPPELTKKVHGISDEMVENSPPFKVYLKEMCEFFTGEKTLVAHNTPFDIYMLYTELRRIDKVCMFPWPMHNVCTMEKTMHLKGGKRTSLDFLCKHYLDIEKRKGSHRAMVDVEDLLNVIKCMRKDGIEI